MVTWVRAAPWIARLGAVVAAIGLFLILTPLGVIGFLLLFWGLLFACVFWGVPRAQSHPVWVAALGAGLAILGGLWTAWNVHVWEGGCPGYVNCLPISEAVFDTLILGGPAVCAGGVALFSLAAHRYRGARHEKPTEGSLSQPSH